ncbi:MAG: ABC transporter ATP-binding protein [Pseudomonadota bacterium]
MSEPTLAAVDVHKRFGEGALTVDVLKGVNLAVNAGESVAILGSSGSGKSTLLHLLGGLDFASSGTVSLAGKTLGTMSNHELDATRNKHLGFVYQFHHLLPEFSALENVAMPLLIGGITPKEAEQRASRCLGQVGLSERLAHRPGELSGGERQRAAIARALVTNPDCILADEPTGNLDSQNAGLALDAMLSLRESVGAALVIVTHDQKLAARLDRIVTLVDGKIEV